MIAFKVVGNSVKQVECEEMKYPLDDSDGDTIYENTHFATKKEAYEEVIKNCYAGVSTLTRRIKETREELRKLEVLLADECIDIDQLKKELGDLEED